jgi:RNA polymerase sigma-32 factor
MRPRTKTTTDARPAPIAFLVDQAANPYEALETAGRGRSSARRAARRHGEARSAQRDIVNRRWLAEPKATLQELADEYGVSAERIRQIEANAFKKMRALFVA